MFFMFCLYCLKFTFNSVFISFPTVNFNLFIISDKDYFIVFLLVKDFEVSYN